MKNRCLIWAYSATVDPYIIWNSSLTNQVLQAEQIAKREGWEIVDTLQQIGGVSRTYQTFHELIVKNEARGIDTFRRLEQYMSGKAFDILLVRDISRISRTPSILDYIIKYIVLVMGGQIYSTREGLLDKSNYSLAMMMYPHIEIPRSGQYIKNRSSHK